MTGHAVRGRDALLRSGAMRATMRATMRAMMRVALPLAVVSCGDSSHSAEHVAARATRPPAARLDRSGDSLGSAPAATDTADLAQSGGVELYSAARLARISADLARSSSSGRSVGRHQSFDLVESRRLTSGVPEVHQRWTDVAVVQAGRATLLAGGRVEGSALAAPGELRGGTILNGIARPIAAGDLLVIPAGVPHQYRIGPGDSIVYLTLKVLEPGTR